MDRDGEKKTDSDSDGTGVKQDVHVHNSSCRRLSCTSSANSSPPPALLLLLHHHHLLPPSLKFCLAYRRCPLLAQSSGRETEREGLDQNQRRSSCAPSIVSAKHSFSLVDQGTRKSNRYFPVSASCKNKKKKPCSNSEFCWQ